MWAEYKDKVPEVPIEMSTNRTSYNSKLKLPSLNICVSKLQKTTKIWMNLCHHNWKTYNYSSGYDVLLPILNTFTFDTEEYCLDINYKVNDIKALKTSIIISVSVEALRLQQMYVEAFNCGLPKSG